MVTMASLALCVVLFLHGHLTVSALIPWPLSKTTGCYGYTADDFLQPTCNRTTPSVMVVANLFGMTKKLATSCPQEATSGNRDEEKCCTVAAEDCMMKYTANLGFYSDCTGRASCEKQVAWMSTSCNHSEYLAQSNYMLLEFYCIPTSFILHANESEDNTASGRAVYLQNDDYPSFSIIGGFCSVSASCNTTILITVIHLNLNNTSSCSQYIHVTDGDMNHTIECSSNNNDDFHIRDVYTSTSHFLLLNLTNENAMDKGHMWIQIMGSHVSSQVELRCGSSAVSVPPVVVACPDPPTSTSTSTSISIASTTAAPTTDGTNEGSTLGIILGVVMGLLVAAGVIILVIYLKKRNKHKVGDTSSFEYKLFPGYNEDGLPVYPFGKTPAVTVQCGPGQTKLPNKLNRMK